MGWYPRYPLLWTYRILSAGVSTPPAVVEAVGGSGYIGWFVHVPGEPAGGRRHRIMTMDKSLKVHRGLVRSRSVLTRGERIERLKASERWKEGDCPLGLPKVRVYKISMKKKKKKKEEEETAEAAPAAAEKK